MYANRPLKLFLGLTLGVLAATACGSTPPEPTSTPTFPPPPPTPLPTEPSAEAPPSDIQPLSAAECADLADMLVQAAGVDVETSQVPFEDHVSGKAGMGCLAAAAGDGNKFTDDTWPDTTNALEQMLPSRGWRADDQYRADGPAGFIAGFRQTNKLCLLFVNREPSDMSLCPEDEPIFVCWADLTPEQKIHTITLTCAQDVTVSAEPEPEPEPVRIEFASDATSTHVGGSLPPGGAVRYVLTAMEGQEMRVLLTFPTVTDSTEPPAILIIWGEDGSVLISDHAEAIEFQGVLPATQDYILSVRSRSQESVNFTLEVIIPPL